MAESFLISKFQQPRIAALAVSLGITIQTCLDEAMEDWMSIVAPARLEEFEQVGLVEAISQNEKLDNLIPFSVVAKAG